MSVGRSTAPATTLAVALVLLLGAVWLAAPTAAAAPQEPQAEDEDTPQFTEQVLRNRGAESLEDVSAGQIVRDQPGVTGSAI